MSHFYAYSCSLIPRSESLVSLTGQYLPLLAEISTSWLITKVKHPFAFAPFVFNEVSAANSQQVDFNSSGQWLLCFHMLSLHCSQAATLRTVAECTKARAPAARFFISSHPEESKEITRQGQLDPSLQNKNRKLYNYPPRHPPSSLWCESQPLLCLLRTDHNLEWTARPYQC